ncbi:hypothetical protein BC829DRAFT_421174 [Chytridium lagenaria]|nr:hypothetical protein BC829DRAFT_421174 [Chytridium lagenaria]
MPTPTSSIHRSAVPEETISAEQFARMEDRLDALLEEIKGLREDNAKLQKRLDAKDEEINRLTRQPAQSPLNSLAHHPLTAAIDNTADGMDTEEGEVLESLSSTKLAAFKQDLTKTVVAEILVAMKEAGMTSPPLSSYGIRRPPPKTFSENFDVNQPRQHSGPMSFATAVRQIAKGNATPDHAARVVFRSTYPRSNVEGITNIYMKGYVQPGPKRFVTVRNALFTLGITSGILEMSFIGKSVVHLLCDSSKAAHIQECLTKKGVFLPGFNPLEVPELVVSSGKSLEEREKEGRVNCIRRLGGLYCRGGQQIKKACLEGFDDDLASEVRTFAKQLEMDRAQQDAERVFSSTPTTSLDDHCQKTR